MISWAYSPEVCNVVVEVPEASPASAILVKELKILSDDLLFGVATKMPPSSVISNAFLFSVKFPRLPKSFVLLVHSSQIVSCFCGTQRIMWLNWLQGKFWSAGSLLYPAFIKAT